MVWGDFIANKIIYLGIAATYLFIAGCGGDSSSDPEVEVIDAPKHVSESLVYRQSSFSPDEQCHNGGVVIDAGFDNNRDQQLSDDEVTNSYTVCHGENADLSNFLFDIQNLNSTDQCRQGGFQWVAGIDTNLNRLLDREEIDASLTQVICANNTAPHLITYDDLSGPEIEIIHIKRAPSNTVIQHNTLFATDIDGDEFEAILLDAPEWLTVTTEKTPNCEDPRITIGQPGISIPTLYICSQHATPISFPHANTAPEGEYTFTLLLDDGESTRPYQINYRVTQGIELSWHSPDQYLEGQDDFAFHVLQLEKPILEDLEFVLETESPNVTLYQCEAFDAASCVLLRDEYYGYELTLTAETRSLILMMPIEDDSLNNASQRQFTISMRDFGTQTHDVFIPLEQRTTDFNIIDDEPLPIIGFTNTELSLNLFNQSETQIDLSGVGAASSFKIEYSVDTTLGKSDYYITDRYFQTSLSPYNLYNTTNYIYLEISSTPRLELPAQIILTLEESPFYEIAQDSASISISLSREAVTDFQFAQKTLDLDWTNNQPTYQHFSPGSNNKLFVAGNIAGEIHQQQYLGGTYDAWYGQWSEDLEQIFVTQFGTEHLDTLLAFATNENDEAFAIIKSTGAGETNYWLLKFNSEGTEVLRKSVDLSARNNKDSFALEIEPTANFIYVFSEENSSLSLDLDEDSYSHGFSLWKLDASGELVWYQNDIAEFDQDFELDSFNEGRHFLEITENGEPILALSTDSGQHGLPGAGYSDWADWLIVKLSADSGLLSNSKVLGSTSTDYLQGARLVDNGELIVWGISSSSFNGETPILEKDIVVTKLSDTLDIVWTHQFGSYGDERLYDVALSEGNIYLYGYHGGEFDGVFNDNRVFVFDYTQPSIENFTSWPIEQAIDFITPTGTQTFEMTVGSDDRLIATDGGVLFFGYTRRYYNNHGFRKYNALGVAQ